MLFVPGMQGLGVSLAIGGVASMANGYGAISTGTSLMSLGGWASVAGLSLIVIGAGAMAFGANEVLDTMTGTNYIQKWTGMSDGLYNGVYTGLNSASTIGTIAGNVYMKYNPRYPGRNPNKIPDGFNDRPNSKANYYNPKTRQLLGPDLDHPGPLGPEGLKRAMVETL